MSLRQSLWCLALLGASSLFAREVPLEELTLSQETVFAETVNVGDPADGVTQGNFPNAVTQGNFPSAVTEGNFPDAVTQGNFPTSKPAIDTAVATIEDVDGSPALPSPHLSTAAER